MNSEENNEKQIEKLERMEKIYADEKRHESVIDKIETEDSDFCAPLRKVFKWVLLIVWLACVAILVTGGDFTIPASGILFSGGIYSALYIPKFFRQNKKGDVVIAAIVALATIGLSVILITGNSVW